MIFLNLSYWHLVGVVNFILNNFVDDWLNVMLNVVNVSIDFTFSENFFSLDMSNITVSDVIKMFVVVSSVCCGRIKLGSN